MGVNIDLNEYNDEDLYLLKDKIDCLIHARAEADKKAKIDKFYDAFMTLNKNNIDVYVCGDDGYESRVKWDDFTFS